eukprot:TRINITY_DN18777_c0_g2_i1.p1 TRINITY_DN18777_c0_g2~~TRINITY_DN18777_c0_g2_i1.p1  ORF type:complete len:267 (-),score=28.44 TRINITY_DN18777_c0_g2_i1:647-1387(-)
MKAIMFILIQICILPTIKGWATSSSSSSSDGWTSSSTASGPGWSKSSATSVSGYGSSSSSSSSVSYSSTSDSWSVTSAIQSGNIHEINKVITNGETDAVASAIVNMDSGQWWSMARYVYETGMEKSSGSWELSQLIKILERIISDGGCSVVFGILQELDAMVVEDAVSEQLQALFSGSKIILECVDNNTERTVVQVQNPCVESTSCIFLLQSTRFLLNEVPECGGRRVCNFIGFDQQPICERECET